MSIEFDSALSDEFEKLADGLFQKEQKEPKQPIPSSTFVGGDLNEPSEKLVEEKKMVEGILANAEYSAALNKEWEAADAPFPESEVSKVPAKPSIVEPEATKLPVTPEPSAEPILDAIEPLPEPSSTPPEPPPPALKFVPYPDVKLWDEWGSKTFDARDEIVVTEYVWGLGCSVHLEGGNSYLYGSFSEYPGDPENPVRKLIAQLQIEEKLRTMFPKTDLTLYGVVCGTVMDKAFFYEMSPAKFLFFDLTVAGKIMPDYQLIRLANMTGFSRVPICYRGKYNSLAIQHAGSPSKLFTGQPKAGIIIKSDNNPNHPLIGRKILAKYSPEFITYQSTTGDTKTTTGE